MNPWIVPKSQRDSEQWILAGIVIFLILLAVFNPIALAVGIAAVFGTYLYLTKEMVKNDGDK